MHVIDIMGALAITSMKGFGLISNTIGEYVSHFGTIDVIDS